MVAGLIALAVANEMAIAHSHGHASAALSLLLFGGPVFFLLTLGWYMWVVPRVWPRLRVIIGSAALVPVGIAASIAPPLHHLYITQRAMLRNGVQAGEESPLR